MPNYANSKIYKLINDINDDIYVGSTTQMLCRRMTEHRTDSSRCENRLYISAKTIGGFNEHFKIVLIENYPCKNKEELSSREQFYIDKMKPSLNSIRSSPPSSRMWKCTICCISLLNAKSKIDRHLNSKYHKSFIKHI